MCRETAPRGSRLIVSSRYSRSVGEEEMEYERFILAPPIPNATLRNWPGTKVKGSGLPPGERRRNVFTDGVSLTMLSTRTGVRFFVSFRATLC